MAGRPPRLTTTIENRIVEAIEAGDTQRVAAEVSGLGSRTLDRYMARGLAAEEALRTHFEAVGPIRQQVLDRLTPERYDRYQTARTPEREQPFWRLWRAVTRARAASEERALFNIREAGQGYEASERIVVEKQVLDRNGNIQTLVESRTVTRFVRDWRAESWYLERLHREDYAPAPARVEVSGEGGGPVNVEDVRSKQERAVALVTDRVAEKRDQRARAKAAAAGQVAADG